SSNPAWKINHNIKAFEITASPWHQIENLVNSGTVTTFPRLTVFSKAASQGYLAIENLRTERVMYYGKRNTSGVWIDEDETPTDDNGMAVTIDCDRTEAWWLDGRENKLDYFSGLWLYLLPGNNPVKISLETIGGSRGDIVIVVDWFDLEV
ncbi:MAG: hypothetical protein GY841_05260, partial [FCB group bacterium]|nr:hypothetical protein [FCB group bacterium]